MSSTVKRLTVPQFVALKSSGQKITVVTAYDFPFARMVDEAGVEAILVGDSLGMVVLGYDSTLPVTLEDMLHHTKPVVRGTHKPLVVTDLPFMTYQTSVEDAMRNAGRLIQEGGAQAVKLEGGVHMAETVRRLTQIGIPVVGHIGLTPQAVHWLGGFRTVGKTGEEAERLFEDARALERAGAFSIVLECMPVEVSAAITSELKIPTIGIGAGPHCDGQVLVSYDAFGIFDEFAPRFVKQYANLGTQLTEAAKQYITDVQEGRFPAREHSVEKAK